MHIPKTGGISLSTFLRSVFPVDETCPAPVGDGRWRHRPSDVGHFNLFIGHYNIDFIDAVDPQGFKITILRNPRERIVSTYDFWRSIPAAWSRQLASIDEDAPAYARTVSFAEFLRSDKPWVQDGISNSAARQLLGKKYDLLSHDKEAAVQAAIDGLLDFDWFSTTNTLSDDLPLLASYFGVSPPCPSTRYLNGTYDYEASEDRPLIKKTSPTLDDLRQIDHINEIDEALYREALRHSSFRNSQ